jgi:hypothetical protein
VVFLTTDKRNRFFSSDTQIHMAGMGCGDGAVLLPEDFWDVLREKQGVSP